MTKTSMAATGGVPEAIELSIEGMSCAACSARAERALAGVPGVASAVVNLATERATVKGEVDVDALIAAVDKAGYDARVVIAENSRQLNEDAAARKDAEQTSLMRDLVLALMFALPVFVLEMGSHAIPAMHRWIAATLGMQTSWYLQFVLTTLVLLMPGRRFFSKGVPALLRLAPDMNSLVSVGTLAAYLYSAVATFASALRQPG